MASASNKSSSTASLAASSGSMKRGVNVDPDQLKKFGEFFGSRAAVGLSGNTSVSISVTNGQGSWSNTYHTFGLSVSGTAQITAPGSVAGQGDNWQIKVYGSYESKTIWSGRAYYGQSKSFSYSTSWKAEVSVQVRNLTNPNFNGRLTVQITAGL